MQNRVARAQERKQRGGNRRHAAGENSGLFRLVPDRQTVLQDFKIRVVETRIDEAGLLAWTQLATARRQIEEILALLRILEDESRREKDRRLERTLREAWCIAIAHHQRFRVQPAIGDPVLMIIIACHGVLLSPTAPRAHGEGELLRFGKDRSVIAELCGLIEISASKSLIIGTSGAFR